MFLRKSHVIKCEYIKKTYVLLHDFVIYCLYPQERRAGMYRKITHCLEEWQSSNQRKPLIIQGARQVGKTYSILEFGRNHYENVAYFNFERNTRLRKTFDEDISPDYLIPLLSHITGQPISKETTLIVFDEIQVCERALTSLKYFYEEAPEYHIIVAGSLLGVAVNRQEFSYPVGKVITKTMYPMDMEEFLIAAGQEEMAKTIRECFETNKPMPSALHDSAMQYYRQYLLVGGMPECVMQFVETRDYILVRNIQTTILANYLDDMSKYNQTNEIKRTRLTYNTVTTQLSKKNTRFQYRLIKKGARAAEFENAIEWLTLSGIVYKVNKVERPSKPLDDNKDIDAFKIYVSDLGLLCAKKELMAEDVLYMGEDSPRGMELEYFKGGMAENYVNTHLMMNGYTTYYWESARGAEVDFVIQRDGYIIPIEVKSADNTQAKSLKVYMEAYKPQYALKVSAKNFGYIDGKKIVPLYAVFCI